MEAVGVRGAGCGMLRRALTAALTYKETIAALGADALSPRSIFSFVALL